MLLLNTLRVLAVCALVVFTGCAGFVTPGGVSILALVLFLSLFSAGCRALLEPEEPSDTALRLLLTGDPGASGSGTCSNTVDYTKSFHFDTYDPGADGTGVTMSDNGSGMDSTGYSATSSGDFNGDGLSDVAFSAPNYNSSTGRVYIVYGTSGLSNLNLGILDKDDGIFIRGEALAMTQLGDAYHSVNFAGDVNGDGYDDLLIGNRNGNGGTGRTWLIFGTPDRSNIDLSMLSSSQGISITGATAGGYLGQSTTGPGDMNGDGIDDIVIGELRGATNQGRIYVYYGRRSGWSNITTASITGSDGFHISGEAAGDYLAETGSAGDINGDGIADLIIGAATHNAMEGAGYVIYGQNGTGRADIALSGLSGSDGYKLTGFGGTGSYWGAALGGLGDFNGDGVNDTVIGATYSSGTGKVAVLFGNTGAVTMNALTANQGFLLTGPANSYAGKEATGGGDLNGDGINDLIVGAALANTMDGQAWVIFGRSGHVDANLTALADGVNGIQLDAKTGGSHELGHSLDFMADFNGDFCDDLLITQSRNNYTGNVYVIYGGRAR